MSSRTPRWLLLSRLIDGIRNGHLSRGRCCVPVAARARNSIAAIPEGNIVYASEHLDGAGLCTGAGKLGINDRKRAEYGPMCSKGPGLKTYHITVFALSETLKLSPSQVSRAALLDTVKDITLGETTLDVEYERK